MESEDADDSQDVSKINKSEKNNYVNLIFNFLKEETEILDELNEEIVNNIDAKKVLVAEKTRLLEKLQDLEEKYVDIKQRHDAKTEMVGKLSIKAFILTIEIEKLNKLIKP